jgi:hypothetical protein
MPQTSEGGGDGRQSDLTEIVDPVASTGAGVICSLGQAASFGRIAMVGVATHGPGQWLRDSEASEAGRLGMTVCNHNIRMQATAVTRAAAQTTRRRT